MNVIGLGGRFWLDDLIGQVISIDLGDGNSGGTDGALD